MGEETKQAEVKKEEKVEEKSEEEEAKKQPQHQPSSPFVLLVDLHCMGCAKKIERSILKIRGVEGAVMDMAQNQVTIKGLVEPQVVCAALEKKTRRPAQLLSPLAATQGDPIPQVSGLTTVELKVNMHCEACADQLKRQILKMKGVRRVETEVHSGRVTVTGTMDSNRLVDYVYSRTKKQVKVVPAPDPPKKPNDEVKPAAGGEEPKPEGNKDEHPPADNNHGEDPSNKKEEGKQDEGGGDESTTTVMVTGDSMNENQQPSRHKMMMYYYQPPYVIERIPPPQLFSDENPNACCIS